MDDIKAAKRHMAAVIEARKRRDEEYQEERRIERLIKKLDKNNKKRMIDSYTS